MQTHCAWCHKPLLNNIGLGTILCEACEEYWTSQVLPLWLKATFEREATRIDHEHQSKR